MNKYLYPNEIRQVITCATQLDNGRYLIKNGEFGAFNWSMASFCFERVELYSCSIVGSRCNFSCNCVIDSDSVIGNDVNFKGTKIGHHCLIGDNSTFSDGNGKLIGNFCRLGKNTKTGKFNEIGMHVKLGANSSVDVNSIIGTQFEIGKNSTIGACTEVGYGSKIGDNSTIGSFVRFAGGDTIGDNVAVGAGVHFGANTKFGANIKWCGIVTNNIYAINNIGENGQQIRIAKDNTTGMVKINAGRYIGDVDDFFIEFAHKITTKDLSLIKAFCNALKIA